jgi:hypothetical protein
MYLVTPKARAKHEHLFNKPALPLPENEFDEVIIQRTLYLRKFILKTPQMSFNGLFMKYPFIQH